MASEIFTGPLGRNVNELIRQIKAIQEVAKNSGMADSAGWKPDDTWIVTDKECIGKY